LQAELVLTFEFTSPCGPVDVTLTSVERSTYPRLNSASRLELSRRPTVAMNVVWSRSTSPLISPSLGLVPVPPRPMNVKSPVNDQVSFATRYAAIAPNSSESNTSEMLRSTGTCSGPT
jgi:hypothetical protein